MNRPNDPVESPPLPASVPQQDKAPASPKAGAALLSGRPRQRALETGGAEIEAREHQGQ